MKHVQQIPLSFTDKPQCFAMPERAKPLAFDVVDNSAWLLALVDSEAKSTQRYFTIIRSQTVVPENAIYVGTSASQQLFYHLFENSIMSVEDVRP